MHGEGSGGAWARELRLFCETRCKCVVACWARPAAAAAAMIKFTAFGTQPALVVSARRRCQQAFAPISRHRAAPGPGAGSLLLLAPAQLWFHHSGALDFVARQDATRRQQKLLLPLQMPSAEVRAGAARSSSYPHQADPHFSKLLLGAQAGPARQRRRQQGRLASPAAAAWRHQQPPRRLCCLTDVRGCQGCCQACRAVNTAAL